MKFWHRFQTFLNDLFLNLKISTQTAIKTVFCAITFFANVFREFEIFAKINFLTVCLLSSIPYVNPCEPRWSCTLIWQLFGNSRANYQKVLPAILLVNELDKYIIPSNTNTFHIMIRMKVFEIKSRHYPERPQPVQPTGTKPTDVKTGLHMPVEGEF